MIQGQPGTMTAAGVLTIENLTDQSVSVQLRAVDALTTSTLGSAYQAAGSDVHGATHWLALSASTLSLAPHARSSVAVSVDVPASAAPGDYLSGISVLGTDQSARATTGGGAVVEQQYRYAVGVEIRLPGARRGHLGFSGAQVTRQPFGIAFSLSAHNDGNVILTDVTGQATVTQGGRAVASQTIAPGTFVSGTDIAMPVRAPGENPAPGTVYRVRAELHYAGGVAYLDTLVTFGHAAPRPSPARHGGGAATRPVTRAPGGGTSAPRIVAPQPSRTTLPRVSRPAAPAPATRRREHPSARRTPATARAHAHAPIDAARRAASPGAWPRSLARAVAAVAKRSVFPALLIVVMALFFLLQDRIDRRDPKLALAPVYADPRLDFS